MSILSSTKGGKNGIEITAEYLKKRGYYYKLDGHSYKNKPLYYSNDHFVFSETRDTKEYFYVVLDTFKYIDTIKNDDNGNPIKEKLKFRNYIYINSLAELELLERFWNEINVNKKVKYKKQLLRLSKIEVLQNQWWFMPNFDK